MEENKKKKMIEPIIFEDPNAPKQPSPFKHDIRTKDTEEKVYIILYQLDDDLVEETFQNIYTISRGRTPAYEDIQNKLQCGLNVDIHRSKVLVETKQVQASTGDAHYYLLSIDDAISIYSFCKSIEGDYQNYNFDIENYNDSDVPSENEDVRHVGLDRLTKEQEEYLKMIMEALAARNEQSNVHQEGDNI